VAGFDELFGEDYLWFWEPALPAERSEREAELVWRLLGLTPGMEVLDLACGHGRIANRLAQRGARVTGLDRSALFLERARADAAALGVEVEYVEGDMCAIPWEGRFDAVLNWFTAFGYHPDDELHGILRGARNALKPKPGGRFVLETLSITEVLGRFQPEGVTERDGDFLLERRRYNPVRGGIEVEFVAIRGEETRRYDVFVRQPTFTELRDWLLDAGFARVKAYGEDGEPLRQEHRRIVALAIV
jgi:SAM-dependent methyltransferase